ncbi:major facilitator superfamily domain-containing protein [Biscogniauxia marginata]|nr:major facilitator superfamily domain-containing protein [Biscogniauxia marginata]
MAQPQNQAPGRGWNSFFEPDKTVGRDARSNEKTRQPTWNMGILNDRETIQVPGSVLLLTQGRNEPFWLRNVPARTSHSSLATGVFQEASTSRPALVEDEKKMTEDGQIILEPQPDDSHNDPLNWPAWRRDSALLALGLYCMAGGGITPIIAAGFTEIASGRLVALLLEYINVADVSLTTGLYMMGLGIGCVIFSPTAVLYGKRPVYLFSAIIFIVPTVWCALSPTFTSLLLARIFQGIAVSPIECLPSATIAEIFFLHERAWLNLFPLVSSTIFQRFGWRIVAIVVALCGGLLFLFVPETFWDRSPTPRSRRNPKRPYLFTRRSSARQSVFTPSHGATPASEKLVLDEAREKFTIDQKGATGRPTQHQPKNVHVWFAPNVDHRTTLDSRNESDSIVPKPHEGPSGARGNDGSPEEEPSKLDITFIPARPNFSRSQSIRSVLTPGSLETSGRAISLTPEMHNSNSPCYWDLHITNHFNTTEGQRNSHIPNAPSSDIESEKMPTSNSVASFVQQLKIHYGRLNQDKWWKAAIRPLIMFSYPLVLWSAVIYACSVGWLIVILESVAIFRLVMAAPVAITTVIGLMGFGWSVSVNDDWIVPTVFFGIVSFGCPLGSTTAITFCVDSYRQYAGEALATLNLSKNVFHLKNAVFLDPDKGVIQSGC